MCVLFAVWYIKTIDYIKNNNRRVCLDLAIVTNLNGVIIRKGCVIVAGSVMCKNIESYSEAERVPAKLLKSMFNNH